MHEGTYSALLYTFPKNYVGLGYDETRLIQNVNNVSTDAVSAKIGIVGIYGIIIEVICPDRLEFTD